MNLTKEKIFFQMYKNDDSSSALLITASDRALKIIHYCKCLETEIEKQKKIVTPIRKLHNDALEDIQRLQTRMQILIDIFCELVNITPKQLNNIISGKERENDRKAQSTESGSDVGEVDY